MNGTWAIRGEVDPFDGEQLYWSNTMGWVSLCDADTWPDTTGNLPIGGEWVQIGN